MEDITKEYKMAVAARVKQIRILAELEIEGFAKITEVSKDILYSINRGDKRLTPKIAKKIGVAFEFDENIIFDLTSPIPNTIKNSKKLKDFRENYKYNVEFFSKSWTQKKLSNIINTNLIQKGFFKTPKYAFEVRSALIALGEDPDNALLHQQLKYFSEEKKPLKKQEAKMKNKLGEDLVRVVYIYEER